MTDAEILWKARCLEELNKIKDARIGQFFTLRMDGVKSTQKSIEIHCSDSICNPLGQGAYDRIVRKIREGVEEYKKWLRSEVDKE